MSERDNSDKAGRPRTRLALHNLKEGGEEEKKSRRSTGHHSASNAEHTKKCFICYSEAERETSIRKKRQRQSAPATVTTSSTQPTPSTSTQSISDKEAESEDRLDYLFKSSGVLTPGDITDILKNPEISFEESPDTELKAEIVDDVLGDTPGTYLTHPSPTISDKDVKQAVLTQNLDTLYTDIVLSPDSPHSVTELSIDLKRPQLEVATVSPGLFDRSLESIDLSKPIVDLVYPQLRADPDIKTELSTPNKSGYTRDKASVNPFPSVAVATQPTVTLASSVKPQQQQTSKAPSAVPPPTITPSKTVNNIPLPTSHPAAHIPKTMTSTGPMTRLKAQGLGAFDGQHRQISAANIDEATLDQCFHVQPKWHYIKSNHEETSQWLESSSFESILMELLYFAHDQGNIQQKEIEGQFEKEVERAMESIEKVECLDAFCKTFIRDNRFRPVGKVILSGSGKNEKHNRLFRMINADLQNLQRQHRILSMVCSGTADHEVHTQAQRENLRKLVEDLVTIVHPGDRGTYSEVYKVITENATYDQRSVKPQLTSLKLVSHPDIVVPFGGPIMAGGSLVRCDALEHKIRAKLPSLLIKMHFSDHLQDQKWPDLTRADDSGIGTLDDTSILDDTGTGNSRARSKDKSADDKAGSKTNASSGKSSSKRKHEETTPIRSKRHREDLYARETQPPDAHVINEIYGEHVSQLICSLASSPMGYIKHCKYTVPPTDERDGNACVTVLGMIVSGEDIYLTKMDASHDYLDSMVETFRMDQLSFSCLANPLNLYKGTHLKALLMFLRYICLNFPRTTYFLSD